MQRRQPPRAAKALACCFLLFPWIAGAQNLATNPGFETGDTTGWSPFGSPTISATTAQVHSGNYAGLVTNRTATWMGISQSFLGVMQASQTCNVSVWLRLTGGADQTMQVTAAKTDGSGTTYTLIASGTVSASAWTQLSGQYTLTVSGTLTSLTIYFEVPGSTNAAYYADDFLVQLATPPSTNGQCTVDWGTVFQRIDGFGASSAWRSIWTSQQADMFFSTNASGTAASFDGKTNFTYTGIGLSLLRTRIAPGGTTVENSIMQMAQARGARVWSTPWSPAANFKSNTNVNGGSFVGTPANYQAYANQLAGYVANMKSLYGVNLYALSIQNEPDANVTTYEACYWSAQQFHDFVPYLYSALAASNVAATKIMLPESQNWQDYSNLAATAMSDSTSNDVSIIADHNYDGMYGPVTLKKNSYGKALWETEVALLSGSDSSITNGVYYAGRIHQFLTLAQANAWHYWWLVAYSTSNEGLVDTNGVPAKRMYALGQFSRFVRPNYYRINVANNTIAQISAYTDAGSPNFAIVAVNTNPVPVTQTFYLTNVPAVSSVTPWLTTSDLSLSNQPPVTVTNSSFSYSLPALSIATFAGQFISNAPPVFAAVSNQIINPDMTLVLTNSATDTNSPPQTLAYTLLSAPTNATLNASNGLFTWRPLLSQANTTNLVSVRAADNGTPPMSATDSFKITVKPVTPPSVSASSAGGQVNIIMNGTQGPDYSLLVSSNLATWQVLFTTNSPMLPVTFGETNTRTLPARFYRVQIGP